MMLSEKPCQNAFLILTPMSITAPCPCAGRLSSPFSHATGPCGSEKNRVVHHPCLGRPGLSSYARQWGGKHAHERGSGTAQTAPAAAGVLATTPLDPLPHWPPPRVCGAVSLTPGNAPFLLRQCPQEPVLLSRLWSGGRPDSFCRAVAASLLPAESRLPPATRGCGERLSATRASRRLLPVAAPPSWGSGSVSTGARTARPHPHGRTRHRLRSRRESAPPSGGPRLFLRVAVAGRADQPAGPRPLLAPHPVPLPRAGSHRQPVWPEYRRRFPAPALAPLLM